jgi:hypothetical protein
MNDTVISESKQVCGDFVRRSRRGTSDHGMQRRMDKHDLTFDEIRRAAAAYIHICESDNVEWEALHRDFYEALIEIRSGPTIGTTLDVGIYASELRKFLPGVSQEETENAMRQLLIDSPARVALGVLERYASEVSNYGRPSPCR